jgi:hypothetical protein
VLVVGELRLRDFVVRVDVLELDQSPRFGVRERPQKDAVHHGEDRRSDTDAEGERGENDRGERRSRENPSYSVAGVVDDGRDHPIGRYTKAKRAV